MQVSLTLKLISKNSVLGAAFQERSNEVQCKCTITCLIIGMNHHPFASLSDMFTLYLDETEAWASLVLPLHISKERGLKTLYCRLMDIYQQFRSRISITVAEQRKDDLRLLQSPNAIREKPMSNP